MLYFLLRCVSVSAMAFLPVPCLAADSTPSEACGFGAYVVETDPTGLNVRQSPERSGKIIGVLPAMRSVDGYNVKIEVTVLGSKDGWFLVSHARDNELLTGEPPRSLFSGTGWVSGKKLSVKSQSQKGYIEPRRDAQVGAEVEGGFDSDPFVEASQLVSCQGSWALVEYSLAKLPRDLRESIKISPVIDQKKQPSQSIRLWMRNLCDIQETTCDGLEE